MTDLLLLLRLLMLGIIVAAVALYLTTLVAWMYRLFVMIVAG